MIRPVEYIHPEDEAALRNMEAIPGFPQAIKLLLKYYDERLAHGINMANTIRLSPTQLPHIYRKLPPICQRLNIEEPEFYLQMSPEPNAYAMGDTRTMITLTSGLLEYLTDEEVDTVIAHECGHIACHHMLYHTLAQILVQRINGLGLLGNAILPVFWALQYWSRRSELSADRASAVATGDPMRMVNVLIRLSGGPIALTKDINIEEFVQQAEYYDDLQKNNKWDKLIQDYNILMSSHPYAAIRVREILKWEKSEQWKRIKAEGQQADKPHCPACRKPVDEAWKYCQHCGHKLG